MSGRGDGWKRRLLDEDVFLRALWESDGGNIQGIEGKPDLLDDTLIDLYQYSIVGKHLLPQKERWYQETV